MSARVTIFPPPRIMYCGSVASVPASVPADMSNEQPAEALSLQCRAAKQKLGSNHDEAASQPDQWPRIPRTFTTVRRQG